MGLYSGQNCALWIGYVMHGSYMTIWIERSRLFVDDVSSSWNDVFTRRSAIKRRRRRRLRHDTAYAHNVGKVRVWIQMRSYSYCGVVPTTKKGCSIRRLRFFSTKKSHSYRDKTAEWADGKKVTHTLPTKTLTGTRVAVGSFLRKKVRIATWWWLIAS